MLLHEGAGRLLLVWPLEAILRPHLDVAPDSVEKRSRETAVLQDQAASVYVSVPGQQRIPRHRAMFIRRCAQCFSEGKKRHLVADERVRVQERHHLSVRVGLQEVLQHTDLRPSNMAAGMVFGANRQHVMRAAHGLALEPIDENRKRPVVPVPHQRPIVQGPHPLFTVGVRIVGEPARTTMDGERPRVGL